MDKSLDGSGDERFFEDFADGLPEMAWSATPEGNIEYRNRRCVEYSGVADRDAFGDAWITMLHPEERAATATGWLGAVSTGEPFEAEYRLRRHDGVYRWHTARAEPQRDETGRIVRWVGTCTDVDDAKTARRASVETLALLASVLQSIGDALVTIDLEGNILTWNAAAERLFGYSEPEVVGRSITLLSRAEDRDETQGRVDRSRRGEKIPPYEAVRVRRDGRTVRVVVTPSVVRFSDDMVIGLAATYRDVTDRRAVLEARTRLAAIVESCSDAVVAESPDGSITDWNGAAERLFGYGSSEAVGRPVSILVPPERAAEAEAFRCRVSRGERVEPHETVRLTKLGRRVEVALSVSPILDADGAVVGAANIAQDISERKRADEDLRRSEELFRGAFEDTNVPMVVTDMDNRFVRVNAAFAAFFGYSVEEMLALDLAAVTHPDDLGESLARREELVASRATHFTLQKRYRHRSGKILWGSTNVSLVRDAEGRPLRYVGQVQDITERKLAEETLRLRERAIEAVSQGIVLTDPTLPDNPIVYASPSFERMTGYSPEEALGRNCRFLQGRETNPEAVARLRRAAHEGRSVLVELLNYRKDGSTFWNATSVSPVRDLGGNLTHFVGVLTDVTERRRLEEQYRQAQKMDAIGQLAGGVAHDFNNLLTVINGYSEILLDTLPADDQSRELLVEILKAGERSAELTRQMLTFSRQQVLAPRVIVLNPVVAETEKMLRRLIGADIRLAVCATADLWPVLADPGQVGQVLMNLAVNARDAMPRGGCLTIETQNVTLDADYVWGRPDARRGDHVLLAVSDSGVGMPPEVQSRIFEPFFTTKEAGRGTGLGLSTVYGIVKQSGGHVAVYSEPGKGTTFKVYLPRADSAEEGQAAPDEACPSSARGHETILLVEDDEGVRRFSRMALEGSGYRVLVAANGEEAEAIASAHLGAIHLIVTDVILPGGAGPEVAERIAERHAGVKRLFVSGYTCEASVRHGVLEKGVQFLQKPFSPACLARKVREVLDSAVASLPA
jgi:two-component system, cell cycle sensor histidine kinase and response regulator CckA